MDCAASKLQPKTYVHTAIKKLSAENLEEAIHLLKLYGSYMYQVLALTAGKAGFYSELGPQLLEKYDQPGNEFLLAYFESKPVACVAIRRWDNQSCEMKRMFVLPHFRNKGIASFLTQQVIDRAKRFGYKKVLLDTNLEMQAAVRLYKKHGFTETGAYVPNENANVIYLEKQL
jgi:ribosomal protein S18 acetylase RimI-like enzyme